MDETRVESRKSPMERIAHGQRNRDRHEPGASEICKTDVLWTPAVLYSTFFLSFQLKCQVWVVCF